MLLDKTSRVGSQGWDSPTKIPVMAWSPSSLSGPGVTMAAKTDIAIHFDRILFPIR